MIDGSASAGPFSVSILTQVPGPLHFVCNDREVSVEIQDGETLLSVLRERLRITSVKDGCAPQGQCGCCTVLVDGSPRVSCVTPAARIAGRSIVTLEGMAAATIEPLVDAFVETGASQCGFCTPGILMRCAALVQAPKAPTAIDIDRALAAHLCRCTGWQTIVEALHRARETDTPSPTVRDLVFASERASLEGGSDQKVGREVVFGRVAFSDDTAPIDALVAIPKPSYSESPSVVACEHEWVVRSSLFEARRDAAKVQGRKTTASVVPPIPMAVAPPGGVALATSFVEPGYLEPDASWAPPDGASASPLANGGAFGAKVNSIAAMAAHELATKLNQTVRVVLSREDVVRLGPKRAPISATARYELGKVTIRGSSRLPLQVAESPYGIEVATEWAIVDHVGPSVSPNIRAPFAEATILIEGALEVANFDRPAATDGMAARALLDVCVQDPRGGIAGVQIDCSENGARIERVLVRALPGRVLDAAVARSYCIGAVHMALGWVLSEGLTVDGSGEIHDLTIRSFGIIRPKNMPLVEVEFLDDDREAVAISDAVFAACAAATWNAVARNDGSRPLQFPALDPALSRSIRT